jgi:hypothetical protein
LSPLYVIILFVNIFLRNNKKGGISMLRNKLFLISIGLRLVAIFCVDLSAMGVQVTLQEKQAGIDRTISQEVRAIIDKPDSQRTAQERGILNTAITSYQFQIGEIDNQILRAIKYKTASEPEIQSMIQKRNDLAFAFTYAYNTNQIPNRGTSVAFARDRKSYDTDWQRDKV